MGTKINVTQVQGRSTIINDNLLEKKKKKIPCAELQEFLFGHTKRKHVPEQEMLKGK